MKDGYVYFQEHQLVPARIRIGYSSGQGVREEHQLDYAPVALIHATHDTEQALHAYFRKAGLGIGKGTSQYEGAPIVDYLVWLLDRGFAARNRQELVEIPPLPFDVWRPEAAQNVGRDGQMMLTAAMPPAERIAYARSDLGYLSSTSDEWYTPPHVIELARAAMGGIDTDPASTKEAQAWIRARIWYDKHRDGLRSDLPWEGNVWLNPPYGRGESSARQWIGRLLAELEGGAVRQAITCLNIDSSSAEWFAPIWSHAAAHCTSRGRLNFVNPGRPSSSPTKGTILSYFGPRLDEFRTEFSRVGHVYQIVSKQ